MAALANPINLLHSDSADLALRIAEKEKDQFDSFANTCSAAFKSEYPHIFNRDATYWEGRVHYYNDLETQLQNGDLQIPTWPVAGPLHYGMTLDKMKDVITQKFSSMVQSGRLMRDATFKQNHNKEDFYPTGVKRLVLPKPTGEMDEKERYYEKGDRYLARIWGAEYLHSHLIDDPVFKGAEHFLIIEDGVTDIEVGVYHSRWPILNTIEKNSGYIVSKKVIGKKCAADYRNDEELANLRYQDFTDSGNLIRDADGMAWIVDTEPKSFEQNYIFNAKESETLDFLKRRFEIVSGDRYKCLFQPFKIAVSEIGL